MSRIQQFFLSLGFFTRLPLPSRALPEGARLSDAAWAFPLVGALIGLLAGVAFALATALGIPSGVAAWLAIGVQVALTGGLHEDGLADTADALAPGRSREQKLSILRDSRIGTYGVLALILSLALRAAALGELDGWEAVAALVLAGAGSRACVAVLMCLLTAAREDGLAARAGAVSPAGAWAASLIGVAFLALFPLQVAMACTAALVWVCALVACKARAHFGGVTGDVLGAAQQLAEVALLVIISAPAR